jgi:hypothetical protein
MHRFVGMLSVVPLGRLLHVPTLPTTLHDLHAVSQALLQHTPSMQKLLKQALLALHAMPFSSSQSLDALHDCVGPVQAPSSCPLGTAVHVPRLPATLHASHKIVHVLLQQTPSTHRVLTHSLPAAHVIPLDFLQLPAPSHALFIPTLHAELIAVGGFEGVPCALQTSLVH